MGTKACALRVENLCKTDNIQCSLKGNEPAIGGLLTDATTQ